MSELGKITWHEGAPTPHLAYDCLKAQGPFRLLSFTAHTLPWEVRSSTETRYFLGMTNTPGSLEASDVVRFSNSTADEQAALALFSVLVAGALK